MASDREGPQYYATPEETVRNAKEAFLSALQYNKELNLGIDSGAVARSTPGAPIRRVELDFAKLLTADPAAGFDALVRESDEHRGSARDWGQRRNHRRGKPRR